jgi:hypothetical protein
MKSAERSRSRRQPQNRAYFGRVYMSLLPADSLDERSRVSRPLGRGTSLRHKLVESGTDAAVTFEAAEEALDFVLFLREGPVLSARERTHRLE